MRTLINKGRRLLFQWLRFHDFTLQINIFWSAIVIYLFFNQLYSHTVLSKIMKYLNPCLLALFFFEHFLSFPVLFLFTLIWKNSFSAQRLCTDCLIFNFFSSPNNVWKHLPYGHMVHKANWSTKKSFICAVLVFITLTKFHKTQGIYSNLKRIVKWPMVKDISMKRYI